MAECCFPESRNYAINDCNSDERISNMGIYYNSQVTSSQYFVRSVSLERKLMLRPKSMAILYCSKHYTALSFKIHILKLSPQPQDPFALGLLKVNSADNSVSCAQITININKNRESSVCSKWPCSNLLHNPFQYPRHRI